MIENKKILIVEDEVKVATFIKKGLQTQNFEAEVAETGNEAKRFLRKIRSILSYSILDCQI